jgi:hypothetical protein
MEGLIDAPAWNRPFWADMHSTIGRMEVATITNSAEYDLGKMGGDYRLHTFANIGADFPLWHGNFADGQYGLAVTLPLFMNVWLDLFEPVTAPVVNTDYRFGAPEFAFIHRTNKGFLKNYAIKVTPWKHESTHIGDELTIMRRDEGLPITRVNVSYNYTELALTLNDPNGSLRANHGFRIGALLIHDFEKSWYSMREVEGDCSKLAPMKSPYEFYLQYQYQTNESKNHFQGIASVELRNRVKYGYPTYNTDEKGEWIETFTPEQRTWTINAFLGFRYCHPKLNGYFSKLGLGLRVYHGINPYGQFRSQPNFSQFGVALIFE